MIRSFLFNSIKNTFYYHKNNQLSYGINQRNKIIKETRRWLCISIEESIPNSEHKLYFFTLPEIMDSKVKINYICIWYMNDLLIKITCTLCLGWKS
jgi:hypothetical protein